MKKQNEVWWLMSVENICDIAYAVLVKNMNEFYEHLDRISKYNKYIKSKQVVVYSHIKQYPKSYLLGQSNHAEGILIGASEKQEVVDSKDWKLLKLISDNSRVQLIELSAKLNITPQSVMYRLKKLVKKEIIIGYKVNIDTNLLGYKNYKIYLNLFNNSKNRELEELCKQNQFIVGINKNIGGADFEIELQLQSIEEFHKILDKLRENFSEVIESYEYGIAREEIKMVYFPELNRKL